MVLVSLEALIAGAKYGNIISFPTDTVPALAALPEQGKLIFEAKQRSYKKPLILMAASAEDLWDFVEGSEQEYQIWHKVTQKYWAGALTLVLPASDRVPQAMNPTDSNTIGIRVPDSIIAREILAQTGPLATTSANLSGQPPLQTMAEIAAQFPDVLTLADELADLEVIKVNLPSTVAQWTGGKWQILRQGKVKLKI